MGYFGQIVAVTRLGFSSLPERAWPSTVIVVGMAAVTGVLLSMLSYSAGVGGTFGRTGAPDRAIVLGEGTPNEFAGIVSRDTVIAVMDAPGVLHDEEGQPIVSAEILSAVPAIKKDDGFETTMFLRGVGAEFLNLRPEFHLVSGRFFQPGTHELIIGTSAQQRFEGLEIGDRIALADGDWTIVGSFETGNDIIQGELVADADTVMASVRRNSYGSAIARLVSPDAFDDFKEALENNPALSVSVEPQIAYYDRITGNATQFFSLVAYIVGGLMAVGALFGALNTMYSAVGTRSREIATLRAMGFGSGPVMISVVLEALVLALAGGLIGAAFAWGSFDGYLHSSGSNVFYLRVTAHDMAMALTLVSAVALIGSLIPAARAIRLPIPAALRAV